MTLNINVEYSELRDLQGRYQRFADTGMDEAISEGVRALTERVYQRAKDNIRSLFNTSGRMENALQMTFTEAGVRSWGQVSISGVGYVTQELGGTRPYVIRPHHWSVRRGGALRFEGEAGTVFAPYVIHGPLRSRSYLRKALEDTQAEIHEEFAGRIRATLSKR